MAGLVTADDGRGCVDMTGLNLTLERESVRTT